MNDPFASFTAWYEEAKDGAIVNPDIVALASATKQGQPSVRMVFYRGIREGGFSFFTSYESRKGRELAENPLGAMVFYWHHIAKQLRIEGSVERLSSAESDSYFRTRPLYSQVTARVSRQSGVMLDEAGFLAELCDAESTGTGEPLLRPDNWGGFKLVPSAIEFWTRGEHRRHDRVRYTKEGQTWNAIRLYP
jgi:pyridoxamine 5'-phosphate oxidase